MSSAGIKRSVSGPVAIITGAAGGIGEATATAFARSGVNVALCDNDSERLAATSKRVSRDVPGKVFASVVDLSLVGSIEQFVDQVVENFGRIDILVNNAAAYALKPFYDITADEWHYCFAVNCTGQALFARAVVGFMKARGYGRIINVSSVAGKNGGKRAGAHYAASKGAILSMTRNLARELAEFGITVNAVAPGAIKTRMIDQLPSEDLQAIVDSTALKRLGLPSDVAAVIRFLASDDASFITGETINVNGGILMD